jgi:predicted membrane metal-binding protein
MKKLLLNKLRQWLENIDRKKRENVIGFISIILFLTVIVLSYLKIICFPLNLIVVFLVGIIITGLLVINDNGV